MATNPPYFRHGIFDFRPERLTAREVAMLGLMDAITDKPSWTTKISSDEILDKWRAEATSAKNGLISDKAFDWCITELRDQIERVECDGFVRTLWSAARCAKSDVLVDKELGDELRGAVSTLFNVGDDEKDWHPGSDEKVLNLVHPSLYSLIYGRTRVLREEQVGVENCMAFIGKGDVVNEAELEPNQWSTKKVDSTTSKKFQWLPTQVKFVGDAGIDVKIASYINNLKPVENADLYGAIEKLISKAIPLWNAVLVRDVGWAGPRIRTYGAESDPPERPQWFDDMYDGGDKLTEEFFNRMRDYILQPANPDSERLREDPKFDPASPESKQWKPDDAYEPLMTAYHNMRKVFHPEPGFSFTYEQWKKGDTSDGVVQAGWERTRSGIPVESYTNSIETEFRDGGLQVIVKLASVELTPEKPEYPGGTWHVEGMLNEHIVATAIYYYDVHNTTESRIRFRQEAYLDEGNLTYEQEDFGPLSLVFGTEDMKDEAAVQEIGSLATPHGRIIAFPNTLQHKVQPFELVDKTKAGHRRFLILWLVDPHCKITSTANVAPQQREWADSAGLKGEGLMTLEEAREYRQELMAERTRLVESMESEYEMYNLCEH